MIGQLENIEHRKLTKEEVERLIQEAEPSETKFLRDAGVDVYNFFYDHSLIQDGLVINNRPIYIAALIRSSDDKIKFWTVVNKDTGCIIQLSRHVRNELKKWITVFGVLYATMEKVNPKNMKWVEWLGFKVFEQDENYVTYRIGA